MSPFLVKFLPLPSIYYTSYHFSPYFASICVPKRPPDVPRTPLRHTKSLARQWAKALRRTIDLRGQCCICSTLGGCLVSSFLTFYSAPSHHGLHSTTARFWDTFWPPKCLQNRPFGQLLGEMMTLSLIWYLLYLLTLGGPRVTVITQN